MAIELTDRQKQEIEALNRKHAEEHARMARIQEEERHKEALRKEELQKLRSTADHLITLGTERGLSAEIGEHFRGIAVRFAKVTRFGPSELHRVLVFRSPETGKTVIKLEPSGYGRATHRPGLRFSVLSDANLQRILEEVILRISLKEARLIAEENAQKSQKLAEKREAVLSDFIKTRGSQIPEGFRFRFDEATNLFRFVTSGHDNPAGALAGPWTMEQSLSLCNTIRVFLATMVAQQSSALLSGNGSATVAGVRS